MTTITKTKAPKVHLILTFWTIPDYFKYDLCQDLKYV